LKKKLDLLKETNNLKIKKRKSLHSQLIDSPDVLNKIPDSYRLPEIKE
jgi:hypothetical protein